MRAVQRTKAANVALTTRVDTKQQESINAATLSSILDAVLRVNGNGTIIAANPATTKIFGHCHLSLIGCPLTMLLPEDELSLDGGIVEIRGNQTLFVVDAEHVVTTHKKNGKELNVQFSITELSLFSEKQFVVVIADISERIAYEAKLEQLAMYDSLTNCANRNLLWKRADAAIARAGRYRQGFSVAYLDINDFKPVNDKFGHQTGDLVLQAIAKRLLSIVRAEDLCARVGGDEFVILFDTLVDESLVLQKLNAELNIPIHIGTHQITLSAAIGCADYPQDGNTLDELLNTADKRMYDHKFTAKVID